MTEEYKDILAKAEKEANDPDYVPADINDINIVYKAAAYETNPTYIGDTPISAIYYGNNEIKKVYRGSNQVR